MPQASLMKVAPLLMFPLQGYHIDSSNHDIPFFVNLEKKKYIILNHSFFFHYVPKISL